MVILLKFDTSVKEVYSTIFEEAGVDFKISLRETDVAKASHIVLPDANNLKSVIGKMQMMNLYSQLRIINVPMLAVNNGLCLMCDKIKDINKSGLGFFNIDVNTITMEANSSNGFEVCEIVKTKKTKLLENISAKLNILEGDYISENSYSTSIIKSGNKNISFTMENENHYGIQIDINNNRKVFEKILTNFLQIK